MTDRSTNEAFLYLIACALNEITPDDARLENVDFNELYKLAKFHMMSAITGIMLEKCSVLSQASAEVRGKWERVIRKSLGRTMLTEAETAEICGALERAGVNYMLLKGSVIKNFYPEYGMREMSDCDILYDEKMQPVVREIFAERGYEDVTYHGSNHDVFTKQPFYSFEMHRTLFSENVGPVMYKKYSNLFDSLLFVESGKCERRFTDEDFYVYVIAHARLHHELSGTGIRTLADIYVMNRHFGDGLDRSYVRSELEKIGAAEFEKESRALAEKLFSNPDRRLDESEAELLEMFMKSGAHGTFENRITMMQERVEEKYGAGLRGKVVYFANRLFHDRVWWKTHYPTAYKYPILLPFAWLYRIIHALIFKRNSIRKELNTLKQGRKNK